MFPGGLVDDVKSVSPTIQMSVIFIKGAKTGPMFSVQSIFTLFFSQTIALKFVLVRAGNKFSIGAIDVIHVNDGTNH
jgi:hypothetical protein